MKRIVILALLLSPFAILAQAQTRARRVSEQPAPASSPLDRPPVFHQQSIDDGGQTPPLLPPTQPMSTRPEGATATQEIGDDEVVRIETTLVTVPVSIMDRSGRYVPDLLREDFHIYENGVEQQISYFAAVEKPFTVVLMIDTSASTRAKLGEIKDAARAFVDQLRTDDRVMIVSFAGRLTVLTEATSDRNVLHEAIESARTGPGTRLYDAMDSVMNERLKRVRGRKVIVLFTDGVDTTSRAATDKSNVHDAEELDALIFPIQFDTYNSLKDASGGKQKRRSSTLGSILSKLPLPIPHTSGNNGGIGTSRAAYDRGTAYLREMALMTGGRVYKAEGTDDLPQAFSAIAEELRKQYSLGYYPQKQAEAGERRQLKVRVNRPDVAVRARDSYVYKPATAVPATAEDKNEQSAPPELRKRQFNTTIERPSTRAER